MRRPKAGSVLIHRFLWSRFAATFVLKNDVSYSYIVLSLLFIPYTLSTRDLRFDASDALAIA